MKFTPDPTLSEIILIEPTVFGDERGFFFEAYHAAKFKDAGITVPFVQDNQSVSTKGVLRGMHLQCAPKAQAKCVRVLSGKIYDVAVDVRAGSPTFGKWVGYTLSGENKQMLYIPEGFAHGFLVLSELAVLHYKCSELYSPEHERCLRYDDPDVAIKWPEMEDVILSEKDKKGLLLNDGFWQ